jgi:hypothetical protein
LARQAGQPASPLKMPNGGGFVHPSAQRRPLQLGNLYAK